MRRIALALAVLALGALCIRLGLWQWHRMEQKKAATAAVAERLAAAPVPLSQAHTEWTRVHATGRFLAEREVIVKFMVRDGAPGVDVVTPMLMANGKTVLVNRGWMPSGNDNVRPTNIPSPPPGPVRIEGWWRPDSGAARRAVEPDGGQVRAIASHGLAAFVGQPLVSGYLNLQHPVSEGLAPEPRPHFSSALNFFYALQWWFFAALVLIGLPWLARRSTSASQ